MIPVVLAIGDQIVEAYSRIGLVMAGILQEPCNIVIIAVFSETTVCFV